MSKSRVLFSQKLNDKLEATITIALPIISDHIRCCYFLNHLRFKSDQNHSTGIKKGELVLYSKAHKLYSTTQFAAQFSDESDSFQQQTQPSLNCFTVLKR